MEYKLAKKNNGIRSYRAVDNQVITETQENLILVNNEIIRHNENSEVDLIAEKNRIFIVDSGNTFLYEGNNPVKKFPYPIVSKGILKDRAIFTYEKNIKERTFKRAYFDLVNFSKLNELPDYNGLGQSFVSNEGIFYYNQKLDKLFRINENGLTFWAIELNQLKSINEQPYEFIQFIGVGLNKIWIHLSDNRIASINIDNGQLIKINYLNSELNLSSESDKSMLSIKNIYLDNSDLKIKCLANRFYFEVDLRLESALIKKDFGNSKQSWRITNSTFHENKLYFIGDKNSDGVNRSIGVFDIDQLEVVWENNNLLEQRKYLFFTSPPQVSNSNLYVIDSENNLYEFTTNGL